MLSPGTWHEFVPRDPVENVQFRVDLLRKCKTDPGFARAIKEMCRRDLLFWINCFVWQYNPNKFGEESGPFCTWDFQDEAMTYGDPETGAPGVLECIEKRRDLVIEKSREMGGSWIILLVFLWLWLFHKNKKFLCLSRNETAVDDPADPDSLFWKLDHVLEQLPDFLMPRGWDRRKHRLKLSFENPETRSTITGQAATGSAGIGGRATAILLDEFSRFGSGKDKADYSAYRGTADVSKCRVFVSTHRGEATCFADLCHPEKLGAGVKKLVIHWSRHPEKRAGLYRANPNSESPDKIDRLDPGFDYGADFRPVVDGTPTGGPYPGLRSKWYDDECLRRNDPRAIAMDLDINVRGTVSQYFSAPVIHRLRRTTARAPLWEGEIQYDRSRGEVIRFVEREGGPLKFWLRPDAYHRVPQAPYTMGCDVAEGTGATPSVLSVFNCQTGEKVGLYKNAHVSNVELAPLACALGRVFADKHGHPAYFAWESAGPGKKLGLDVVGSLGYQRVYYRTDRFDNESVPSTKPGWYPERKAKRLLLDEYRAALADGRFVNPSDDGLEECLAFQYGENGADVFHPGEKRKDDPTGAGENHGDEVIADALAWMMAQLIGYAEPKEKRRVEYPYGSLGWRREQRQARDRQEAWGRSALRR